MSQNKINKFNDHILQIKNELKTIIKLSILARTLMRDYVSTQRFRDCMYMMDYNLSTATSLRDEAIKDVKWVDKCIAFFLEEYVPFDNKDNHIQKLKHKSDTLWSSFADTLLSGVGFTVLKDKVRPLDKYISDKTRNWFQKIPISCVVITAVPCEFRALVRRSEAFLKGNFGNIRFYIMDNKLDKEKRTIHKYLDCVYKSPDNRYSKVRVILPCAYGSLEAMCAIFQSLFGEMFTKKHIDEKDLKEIVVCGIAGNIDKNSKLSIGDLLIASEIENITLTKVEGKKDTLTSIKFINSGTHSLNLVLPNNIKLPTWQPDFLFEKPPNRSYSGFKKAEIGKFLVSSSVAKSNPYKKHLQKQERFKNAQGIEMESIAAYIVARAIGKKASLFKSFCDWADDTKKKKGNKKWQPYCADVAASFTVEYILGHYGINPK